MSPSLSRFASALAAAAVILASPLAARAADGFGMVTPDQVEKMLGAPDVKVFDVNVDELWQQHHLPGAVHLGERELATLLPKDKAARLVFYCSGPK
jgi:rhodanese-related sulfurtransferase